MPDGQRREWPRIAIIGGGLGGVAAGVKLRGAGFENFTIFEKSSGPGGTWWDNRYPGAEVDVSSHLYSYSFTPLFQALAMWCRVAAMSSTISPAGRAAARWYPCPAHRLMPWGSPRRAASLRSGRVAELICG